MGVVSALAAFHEVGERDLHVQFAAEGVQGVGVPHILQHSIAVVLEDLWLEQLASPGMQTGSLDIIIGALIKLLRLDIDLIGVEEPSVRLGAEIVVHKIKNLPADERILEIQRDDNFLCLAMVADSDVQGAKVPDFLAVLDVG